MLSMSKREKSTLSSGGLRQMYEMVGYKLCLRFFTIQISEAKKMKGAVQTTGICFSQFRGWDVQDQGAG